MSLKLLYTDLTKFPCDAAVLAADESLLTGGSVFGACGSAAGPSLRDALRGLGGCETGQAKSLERSELLSALRCKKLIVTAAPFWTDGQHHETELLTECYQHSLDEAVRLGCRKIGIGLIDSGIYGFPKETALETAVQAILAHPQLAALDVYLITFDWHSYGNRAEQFAGLERYLNRTLQTDSHVNEARPGKPGFGQAFRRKAARESFAGAAAFSFMACEEAAPLEERIKQLDEGFTEMLLRLIDESGMKDSECYKKANVSRQHFSKIRSNPDYRPKKETVLAFALALRLDQDGTNALLRTAGFSLSHSSVFDIIVEYHIMERIFDVDKINAALYKYDQPLLGTE
ncbi:MAG: macro domain-containing protein [Oscillospiraceae bacterium]|nr:macro domain-containing protein [Oscillospiraceae bacterium]